MLDPAVRSPRQATRLRPLKHAELWTGIILDDNKCQCASTFKGETRRCTWVRKSPLSGNELHELLAQDRAQFGNRPACQQHSIDFGLCIKIPCCAAKKEVAEPWYQGQNRVDFPYPMSGKRKSQSWRRFLTTNHWRTTLPHSIDVLQ